MNARTLLAAIALAHACAAAAAPVLYTIDPAHTFPSFEADHMGMSVWRGKFNKTTGTVMLDKAGGTGEVDLTIEMDSIDFGLDEMNRTAKADGMFDTAQFPLATYQGRLVDFVDGAPTRVLGQLTMRGITRPVELQVRSFKCMPHPIFKRDWCGADARAVIQRDQWGVDAGKPYGFKMDTELRIQAEAVQTR
jgi:polyisoprenoid-binding protein YceI